MKPKIIKTEEEHADALSRVASLMDAKPGSAREAELELWALLVERGSAKFKAGIDVFGPEPSGIELMRALKRQFDPGCVLAPGRFVGGL